MSEITPCATVGPYFLFGMIPSSWGGKDLFVNRIATEGVEGERIRIEGIVYDGDGTPIPDACLEIWQADASGRYAHPRGGQDARANTGFSGFGRAGTNDAGEYFFETIKPGAVEGLDGKPQAPHIAVNVFARGVLKQMVTRIYFADESANASDPILAMVPEDRRDTLIAQPVSGANGRTYRFDVRLQGDGETVFFDV